MPRFNFPGNPKAENAVNATYEQFIKTYLLRQK